MARRACALNFLRLQACTQQEVSLCYCVDIARSAHSLAEQSGGAEQCPQVANSYGCFPASRATEPSRKECNSFKVYLLGGDVKRWLRERLYGSAVMRLSLPQRFILPSAVIVLCSRHVRLHV